MAAKSAAPETDRLLTPTQDKIVSFLKRQKESRRISEIATGTGLTTQQVSVALRSGSLSFIKRKQSGNGPKAPYFYSL